MKKLILFLFVVVFTTSSFSQSKDSFSKSVKEESFKIDSVLMKADERFLSSNELEGRELGERGERIAALYLKTEFEKIGLKGVNGSYYQKFKVLKQNPPMNSSLIATIENKKLEGIFKKDYFPSSNGEADPFVSGKIVFVGYGISSPENDFDEYKNVNVRGKIVLFIAGSPREKDYNSPFGGDKKAAPYRQPKLKIETAIKQGAIGVLYMMETQNRTLNSYIRSFGNFLDKATYRMLNNSIEKSIPFTFISKEYADKLIKSSGKSIDSIKKNVEENFKPITFEIPNTTIEFSPGIKRENLETQNVVGFLEGSDPKLKEEVVVFSAHYDHLGKSGDKIYPGADDDGSGTTAILNIARFYESKKVKPLRSILFIAMTGEEKGLFGSTYYSDNPLFQFEKTYADLNIDMIGRTDNKYDKLGTKNYMYLIGPKIMGGNVAEFCEKANKESSNLILDYEYDDIKDPNIYYRRSDHYNFAKHKVPTIFFFEGEHKDYHKTTDVLERMDFDIFSKRTELIANVGWKMANEREGLKVEKSFP